MTGWGELDLEGKLGVVGAVASIAVSVLMGYATVKLIQIQKKLGKRLHLDEDGDE
jgi:hypothetical protein